MVIGIIGENCSGKSTLAEAIQKDIHAEIVTGKDYLRMAKSESEAAALFRKKLADAVSGANIIYVISEPEQIKLLPDGAVRRWHRCWRENTVFLTEKSMTIALTA